MLLNIPILLAIDENKKSNVPSPMPIPPGVIGIELAIILEDVTNVIISKFSYSTLKTLAIIRKQ